MTLATDVLLGEHEVEAQELAASAQDDLRTLYNRLRHLAYQQGDSTARNLLLQFGHHLADAQAILFVLADALGATTSVPEVRTCHHSNIVGECRECDREEYGDHLDHLYRDEGWYR